MPDTLKLALAMGGGVSLGTFNGAAITEAIKLGLRAARDADGNPYERIEIDVLSGASAGALSLCLLLRNLAAPDPAGVESARIVLTAELPDFAQRPAEQRDDLATIEFAQAVQEEVWGTEAKLAGFVNFPAAEQFDVAGLLNRGAQEGIARARILPAGAAHDFANRRLLASRVLFAMSLTNLSPLTSDARTEFSPHASPALNDALRSSSHRDLRVFDLNFADLSQSDSYNDPDFHPYRWVFLHEGAMRPGVPKDNPDAAPEPWIGDLRQREAWQRLAATAIACGAFPFAFEPVVLERKRYEYGEDPARLPHAFRQPDGGTHDLVNYAFVDGGVFNNEPLREAFRLAAFLDSRAPNRDFDRWVIWVDPAVSAETDDSSIGAFRSWQVKSDHTTLENRTTFEKLAGLVGTFVGVFMNEARVQEGDKVFATRNRLALRQQLRDVLRRGFSEENLTAEQRARLGGQFAQLGPFCTQILDGDRANMMIPPGRLTAKGEVARIDAEIDLGLDATDFAAIEQQNLALATHPAATTLALLLVLLDLTLDAEGKRMAPKLLPISPVLLGPKPGESTEFILPGGKFYGFAGFLVRHEACADFEFRVAKYCARQVLEAENVIGGLPPVTSPPTRMDAALTTLFAQDLETNFPKLVSRLRGLVNNSQLGRLKAIVVDTIIDAALKPDLLNRLTFTRVAAEFRIEVDDDQYLLARDRDAEDDGFEDGFDSADVGKVRTIDGKKVILFFADYLPELGYWRFTHIETRRAFRAPKQSAFVEVERFGQALFTIPFPSVEQLQALLLSPFAYFVASFAEGQPAPTEWAIRTNSPLALDRSL